MSSVAVLLVLGSLLVLGAYQTQGRDPRVPQPGGRDSAVVVVQNRIVGSGEGLAPDRTPAYLSTRTEPSCADQKPSCKVPDSNLVDGQHVLAVCFVLGHGMTNMNLTSLSARHNPGRVSSSLWYRIVLDPRRSGFLSEVYLTDGSRGGLQLRLCPPAEHS